MGRNTRLRKEEQCNDKGWADGARETILLKYIPGYIATWEAGPVTEQEFLLKVIKEFHFYIHWSWSDDKDPEQPLIPYDPSAPPVEEDLTEEEGKRKAKRILWLNKVRDTLEIQTIQRLTLM